MLSPYAHEEDGPYSPADDAAEIVSRGDEMWNWDAAVLDAEDELS